MARTLDSPRIEEKKARAFGASPIVEVAIGGVKAWSLHDIRSEVTTMKASYFYKNFERPYAIGDAHWIKLIAANRLDTPVIGCLAADIQCLGQVLPQKCIFFAQAGYERLEDAMIGVPIILGNDCPEGFDGLFGHYCSFQEDSTTHLCKNKCSVSEDLTARQDWTGNGLWDRELVVKCGLAAFPDQTLSSSAGQLGSDPSVI
ncbi:unnamed protein product [Caretta caretta]